MLRTQRAGSTRPIAGTPDGLVRLTMPAPSPVPRGGEVHPALRWAVYFTASFLFLMGSLVTLGWALDIDVLKRILPEFVTMKVNTALSFALTGVLLFLSRPARPRSYATRWLYRVLLSVLLLTALITLLEYVFHFNAGIDEAFFPDNEHRGSVTYPAGRFSPVTGINFLLISGSFFFMRRRPRAGQALAILVFLTGLLGFVGYAYSLKSMHGPWSPVSLAFHTTVGFLLLALGVIACHHDRGLAKLLFAGPGARNNRWLFAGALALPASLGQIVVFGTARHQYSSEFGLALFTALLTFSFVTLFWITAAPRYATEVALSRSEQQFRSLANAIPHLAWMADEHGSIFWYNDRWYSFTGTTPREMEGWGWQKVHDPQVLPDVLFRWKKAIVNGLPFEMNFPLRSETGEYRTFLTRVEPLKDERQQVIRWFGTNTDITEQMKIQDELRRINRELEEFAYVASHDLQEPLRMVNIYTQRILRAIDPNDRTLEQYGSFVQQGVLRMQALIQDLLVYSRTTHDEQLAPGSASLSEAFSEALVHLKARIDERQAIVSAGPLPAVQGNTSQLASVFQNLISNALKYSKQETAPHIQVSSTSSGDRWIISVRDNGIGFEPQYADRIFGLFKRLHRDEYPGTGIGLAICKRIVERYGGTIWAESRPGDGAVFRFSLLGAVADEHSAKPAPRL